MQRWPYELENVKKIPFNNKLKSEICVEIEVHM